MNRENSSPDAERIGFKLPVGEGADRYVEGVVGRSSGAGCDGDRGWILVPGTGHKSPRLIEHYTREADQQHIAAEAMRKAARFGTGLDRTRKKRLPDLRAPGRGWAIEAERH